MLLFEIGDTRLDMKWTTSGNEHHTSFMFAGEKYFISAVHDKFDGIPAVEVYFSISKDGRPSLEMTNLFKNEFQIISIVSNAIREKFNNEDVIWFSAKYAADKEKTEHRAQAYSKISSRIARADGYFKVSGKIGNDHIFILYRNINIKEKINSYLGIT
jgi:hypothetical protein